MSGPFGGTAAAKAGANWWTYVNISSFKGQVVEKFGIWMNLDRFVDMLCFFFIFQWRKLMSPLFSIVDTEWYRMHRRSS